MGGSWGAKTDLVSNRESHVYLVFKIFNEECRNILHLVEVLFSAIKCMERYHQIINFSDGSHC